MGINPFLPSDLHTIIEKGRYPAYDDETEARRQRRMDKRLEWRRQKSWITTKNRLARIATWYLAGVAAIGCLVLLSELLRLTVWTLLR
jgi:hypothetical protein